jgi:hypothetical protein
MSQNSAVPLVRWFAFGTIAFPGLGVVVGPPPWQEPVITGLHKLTSYFFLRLTRAEANCWRMGLKKRTKQVLILLSC